MGLSAGQGQGGAVVGAGADGGSADQAHVQRAVANAELGAGHVAVGVGHTQARDGQLRVFVHGLCARHGVDGRYVEVDGVVLHGIGHGATGAGDAAFNLRVGVGHQVGCRDVDAENTLGVDRAGDGFVHTIDGEGQGDHVVGCKCARDFAGDGDVACVLSTGDDVVGSDRVDAEGCKLACGGAGFDDVVLCGHSGLFGAAHGGGDAGFYLGVGVGDQVGCGYAQAVVACGVDRGAVGFDACRQSQAHGDHVVCGKGACDFADQRGGGTAAFSDGDDVVTCHGGQGQGGLGCVGVAVHGVRTWCSGVSRCVAGQVVGEHAGVHFLVAVRAEF